ncbi:regulator of chromosome condensation 1/beta-lactamase-inhibitor protein II [Ochromonadaceae sp. CCMP2298]|nr:regulator of chromosome condensation 1/beta-lactamase-inhibitor protein II [Ochromonadaceae sp. CCMP2298]
MATSGLINSSQEKREALTCDDDLFGAIRADDCEALERLLSNGADANEHRAGISCLHLCASVGGVSCAKSLLHHGANVHDKDYESGWTPLHRAFYAGHVQLSFLLLRAGALLEPEDAPFPGSLGPSYPSPACSVLDNEGLSPVDLLSEMLSENLSACAREPRRSSVMSFGKSDFTLGVHLPKSADVIRPRCVSSLSDQVIVQVCASQYHSMALTAEGRVYTWGHGRGGRLGHGDESAQPEPKLVQALAPRTADASGVRSSAKGECVEGQEGQERQEGKGQERQRGECGGRSTIQHLHLGVHVTQIASGENHTLVVTQQGDVYSWGSNRWGQLGHPPKNGGSGDGGGGGGGGTLLHPRRVEALRKVCVLHVAAGHAHSLCATRGDLYAWGSNKAGQLALRAAECSSQGGGQGACLPKRVSIEALGGYNSYNSYSSTTGTDSGSYPSPSPSSNSPKGARILQIAASHCSTLLLVRGRPTPHSRGNNEVYQWGSGVHHPLRVHFSHRRRRGSLDGGEDRGGGSGDRSGDGQFSSLGGAVTIKQVTAGQTHFVACTSDGCVYTWGLGGDRLGHEGGGGQGQGQGAGVSASPHFSPPQLVEALLPQRGGGFVLTVSAAGNRTCAVTRRGHLYSWGACQAHGVLAPGPLNYIPRPRRVPLVKRAVAVAAGEDHTLVLTVTALPPLPLEVGAGVGAEAEAEAETEAEAEAEAEAVLLASLDLEQGSDEEQGSGGYGRAEGVRRQWGGGSWGGQEQEQEQGQEQGREQGREGQVQGLDGSPPSLFSLAQRELARTVDVKTALCALMFSDQLDAPLLGAYCLQFIRANFDSVLAATKAADVDRLVGEMGAAQICSVRERSESAGRWRRRRGTCVQ